MVKVARRRNPTFVLEGISYADIATMREKSKSLSLSKLSNFIPIVMSIVWMFIGTLFYAVHDNLGWAHGLFMSVNVGWSIGWTMHGMAHFDTFGSRMFTMYHTSIGVLFSGVTIMYMMHVVGADSSKLTLRYLNSKKLGEVSQTGTCMSLHHLKYYCITHFSSLKVIFLFGVWFLVGIIWYEKTNVEYSFFQNSNWIMSTLTTGGYLHLPMNPPPHQLLFSAIYTYVGVPLLSITLGLFVNMCLEVGDSTRIVHQATAPVTADEIKLMQEFNVENGDGVVDIKAFVIMAVVRLGSVSPNYMRQLHAHFKELDRKHAGKILYDDFVFSRLVKNSQRKSLKVSHEGTTCKYHHQCLESNCCEAFLFSLLGKSSQVADSSIMSLPDRDINDATAVPKKATVVTSTTRTGDDMLSSSETRREIAHDDGNDLETGMLQLERRESCFSESTNLPTPKWMEVPAVTHSVFEAKAVVTDDIVKAGKIVDPISSCRAKIKRMRKAIFLRKCMVTEALASSSSFMWSKQMLYVVKSHLISPTTVPFYIWLLWLTVGTVFYMFEENVTFCEGFYISVSVGYGLFWFHGTSTNLYAQHFTNTHFIIGVFFVAYAMAVLSRVVVCHKKLWQNEMNKLRVVTAGNGKQASSCWRTTVSSFVNTYRSVICIHCGFLLWIVIGILWGVCSIEWEGMEAWIYCMSAMSTGGFIHLPHHAANWNFAFVGCYVIVGAPLMAVSCGMIGHLVSNVGMSAELERKLMEPVAEDEITLMAMLGVEDGDGFIDAAEFTILILLRIEALNPRLIDALVHRFHEIQVDESGTMTYKDLLKRKSFMGSTSKSLC